MNGSFVLFLSLITLLLIGSHFFVYFSVCHFFKFKPTRLGKGLTLGLSLSFIALSLLTNFFYSTILGYFYALSAILLGTLYWAFWASCLGLLFFGIFKFIKLRELGFKLGKGLILSALFISLYGVVHSYNTQIQEYEVALPQLPEAWQNQKIVLVADTHLGNVRNARFAQKIADLISAQHPQAVLVAGDFVDGPPTNTKALIDIFAGISAPRGIYFANGNHEMYYSRPDLIEALKGSSIHFLKDEKVEVEGLQIVGVDYPTTTTESDQAKILQNLNLDVRKPSILIKHVPNTLKSAAEAGIELQVSGHTHRGQVWPGDWLTQNVYGKFAYGKQQFKNMAMITTSGAGTWGPPQRVGTNGEIVVIKLVKK